MAKSIEFTSQIDPRLKEMANEFSSGLRDISDLQHTKGADWDSDSYVQLLRNWMIGQAYVPLRKAVYGYAKGCMEATPVKTGNARRNWHITSSHSSIDPSYMDMRDSPVSAEAASAEMAEMLSAEAQQAVGKAEGHTPGAREQIQVTNYTPYIGILEARRGMTASGLAEMLSAMGESK